MSEQENTNDGDIPAEQGSAEEYKVGPGFPPKEYQFQPGQSGNTKGVPPSRCNLWRHVCNFMNMPMSEFEKIKISSLTAVQKTAYKIVEAMSDGEAPAAGFMSKHFFDREEGKAVEHIKFDTEQAMSPEKINEAREFMRKKME